MANSLNLKYYLKNTDIGSFTDVTTLFDGVNILKIEGLASVGKTVNVFTQQWVNSQTEDFLITTLDDEDNPIVIRENVDIKITFAISKRYARSRVSETLSIYNDFIAYMTGSDVWIASSYIGLQVHCMALNGFEPRTIKIQRGDNSYIIGELTLHTLEKPTAFIQ